jgi:5-methyltetrahydrofolate--homocysteine methyltransferase
MAIGAGMTSAITNPCEPEIKKAIMAANLMMGYDENCLAWIAAHREASAEPNTPTRQSAADDARAAREARRAARRTGS